MMAPRKNIPFTIHANMTPMIDVVFLLIVFFVAVSQIVDRKAVALNLPEIKEPEASAINHANNIVINLMPINDGEVMWLVINEQKISFDNLGELLNIIKADLNFEMQIQLRADRLTHYSYVYEVIERLKTIDSTLHIQLVIDGDEG